MAALDRPLLEVITGRPKAAILLGFLRFHDDAAELQQAVDS